jgi:hypothetical protein
MNLLNFIAKRNDLVSQFVTGKLTYEAFSTSISVLNMEAVEAGLNAKFILTPDKLATKEEHNITNQVIDNTEDFDEDSSDDYYEESSSS